MVAKSYRQAKLIPGFLAGCMAFLSASVLSAPQTSSCADQFRVNYTVQPRGEVLWISPDHVPQTELPAINEAKAGSTMLTLSLKRRSDTHLIAEFTMSSPDHKEALVASIAMDSAPPTPYSGYVKNVESGSVWGISLLPICKDA